MSSDAKDLVKKLLTVDPQKRITLEEVIEHNWFTNECSMLKLNREKSFGATLRGSNRESYAPQI